MKLRLALLAVLAGRAFGAAPALFVDGDRVAVIGDSITHDGRYHSYVARYYLTRFPTRHVRFFNCGISGDIASGALSRLEWDILPTQPTVCTFMLGMNDVNRGLYGKDDPDAANLKSREDALGRYRDSLTKLAGALVEKLHPQLIFLTPSPYDQTGTMAAANLFGVNDALGRCAEFNRELAEQTGGSVVDFHGPMTALNAAEQAKDPAFTLIGGGRVHPGDVGHLVMAHLFLKAQGAPALVSRVSLDPASPMLNEQAPAGLTELKAAPDGVSFTLLEEALPFPVEDSAKRALELVPFEADLDQEVLQLKGLKAGPWRLSIDDEAVAVYPAEALAEGVNLALNAKTPMYRQALEVAAANEQRHGLEVRLRNQARVRMLLERAKVDAADEPAVRAYFDQFLGRYPADSATHRYYSAQFDGYLKALPELDSIKGEIETLTQQLWQINQPKPHRFELKPAEE